MWLYFLRTSTANSSSTVCWPTVCCMINRVSDIHSSHIWFLHWDTWESLLSCHSMCRTCSAYKHQIVFIRWSWEIADVLGSALSPCNKGHLKRRMAGIPHTAHRLERRCFWGGKKNWTTPLTYSWINVTININPYDLALSQNCLIWSKFCTNCIRCFGLWLWRSFRMFQMVSTP